MSQVTASDWHPMRSGSLGRLAQFHADGTYSIFGMRFDQDTSFLGTRFNDAEVTKNPGVGEILTIAAPNTTHLLRYGHDGQWWHQGEVKKGFFARLFGL